MELTGPANLVLIKSSNSLARSAIVFRIVLVFSMNDSMGRLSVLYTAIVREPMSSQIGDFKPTAKDCGQ